jgi:hypothetical protein
MRKIISLGLLALSLGVFSSSLLAGNEDACDVLKDATPGLYGLCIAYVNAGNDNARDRILGNYDKKKRPGDPDLIDDVLNDEPDVVCPCWASVDFVVDATDGLTPQSCTFDETGDSYDLTYHLSTPDFVALSAGYLIGDPYEGNTGCVINESGSQYSQETSAAEDEACRMVLEALMEVDFGGTENCY